MRLISFLFLFSCLLTAWARADVLSLEQAARLAKAYSPDIQALRNQFESARAKTAQSIAPYEPTFSISFNDMQSSFNTGNAASTVYQIGQQIGFPGKAFISHAVLSNTADAVQAQLKAMELQVATNTKTAYLQLYQAQQNIELNEGQRRSYERILEIAKRRYETGTIPQVDLLNAEVTLYTNANDVSDLKAAERGARAQLNILMGRTADEEVTLAKSDKYVKCPKLSLIEAEQKMYSNRLELKAATSQFRAADNAYGLAKMSLLPDFQLIAGMTHYNEATASPWTTVAPGVDTTYMVGATISVPLWGLFNERQAIVGASRDRAAANSNLQIVINQSRNSLVSTFETLRSSEFRIENYEQHLVPLSEQALRLALINYSAGKIDFQTLVDTATSRRNIHRDYVAGVVSYQTTCFILGQLMGEEL